MDHTLEESILLIFFLTSFCILKKKREIKHPQKPFRTALPVDHFTASRRENFLCPYVPRESENFLAALMPETVSRLKATGYGKLLEMFLLPVFVYSRISVRSSVCFSCMSSGVEASRLSRRRGSVLDGRTLNHQSGYSTFRPSSSCCAPSA